MPAAAKRLDNPGEIRERFDSRSARMKRLQDLTEKERRGLRVCAKVKCVDCRPPCYETIGLPWDEWKKFYHDEWDRLRAQPLEDT